MKQISGSRSHARKCCRHGSDLEFVALPSGIEDDVYRIVQEALHNVVKHAQATTAVVGIAVRGGGKDMLVIDIEDDGVGFRRPLRSAGALGIQSLGMQSMRDRAQRWAAASSCAAGRERRPRSRDDPDA